MRRVLIVTMPGGSTYRIPVTVVARHRASALARERARRGAPYSKAFAEELDLSLADEASAVEWAREQMTWSDVADHATAIEVADENQYRGWNDGEFEITDWPRRAA